MTTRATDYFRDAPHAVRALERACEGWRGTRFRARSLVKGPGGGVDCAGFVGACFAEIGAIPNVVSVPPYHLNHADHCEESVLRSWFEHPDARKYVRLVDEDEPHLDGDMVFPKVGLTEHHLGIRIGKIVYHIVRPDGWCRMSVEQLTLHRSRYRLIVPAA
jgi:cell wall-associated NlpC family hydrolase